MNLVKISGKFFVLVLFALMQPVVSSAQAILQVQDTSQWVNIGRQTAYLKDGGHLSITDITQPGIQNRFTAYNQDVPNFGSTADAVWLKFTAIKNVDQEFYLQVGSAFIDSIALYAVDGSAIVDVQVSGDNYAFANRGVKVTTFLFPLHLQQGKATTYYLRAKTLQPFFFPLRVGTLKVFMEDTHQLDFVQGIYFGFMLLIFLYNLFLYASTREKVYLYYGAYVASITWFMSTIFQYVFEFLWPTVPVINEYAVASSALTILTATLFTRDFLHTKELTPRLHKFSILFIVLGLLVFVLVFTPFKIPALILAQAGIMLMAIYFIVVGVGVYRKGYYPAKYYLLAWSFLIFGFIAAILETINVLPVMYYINSMQIGSAIEVTLLSLALADRINLYKKQREEAQAKALQVAEEKADLILKQNTVLEQKVLERTMALSQSLEDLKGAQAQLVQSEKMASLGELTAGIAHEIQNPLNFVNNFSEINTEILDELKVAVDENNMEEVQILLQGLKDNEQKINHHGKRADSIVKNMLQHSRFSKGEKVPLDLNAIAEEYVSLSYQGLRSKDPFFTAAIKRNLDPHLGKIALIPQDIGRVLLNLFNNAFYAVNERKKKAKGSYYPEVTVTTKKLSNTVEIIVADNGCGIPTAIADKIFQPFFTTKPTGQGTGLGLSLSYDIVKANGGEISMETIVEDEENKGEGRSAGTWFTVSLPL